MSPRQIVILACGFAVAMVLIVVLSGCLVHERRDGFTRTYVTLP